MSLPAPDSDALAASHALQRHIAAEIEQEGGAIAFSRFMELALYAPGLGYYSGGAAKLGADGDFTTAPEMSSLFGAALAQVAAAIIAQSAPRILEFGAGTGKLARDVLTALAEAGVVLEQYAILELSGSLRARQQEALRDFPCVVWLDAMPEAFSGVVLANEVLDAMPVELVRKDDGQWRRLMVTIDDGAFALVPHAPDADLAQRIGSQLSDADALPEGYLTEVHAVGAGFMATLGRMLAAGQGAAILVDYGFPAHEYYHPQRSTGTLMCHYRHHAHTEPFYLPGLQDITAHVDFTAMALAAQDAGAEVLAYMNQAAFLLAAGIGELLLRLDPADPMRYLPQANALQKLVSPAEMGELFKVLVVGQGVTLPQPLMQADRTHRL
ncbi:SAM-dependent methyltransferase [Massilia sp. PAMC28688]|uniref:class I SAM-dependent methyltransferase n=1 Tax=Massilia sp. PAMC28688 TaxID=2861283 RepID=UPI001C630BA6|nr:SAM-dependent methyltransferase [Massilia sp. PAMC28688]QYF94948.1 SAM-dependent methyltransferase [Massilia sp. PAMC28688]